MPDTPPQFVAGWHAEFAEDARAQFLASGYTYAALDFGDDRPFPAGLSLAKFRKWTHNQGQVGTCHENAAVQLFQIHTAADGTYECVQLSRCMVGYGGSLLAGGRNPADGNSVLNDMLAMSDPPKGLGVCHEEKWPYKPDRQYFAAGPPPGAVDDAKLNRVHQVAEVAPNPEAVKRSILNGHPIAIGIGWPGNFDSCDQYGRVPSPGWNVGGHAITIIGWLDAWEGHTYYQIENSHGAIYHILPPDIAARVPGYVPAHEDKTNDFWCREDWLMTKLQGGEVLTAAGLTGFKRRELDFGEALIDWTRNL